jgi:hypothetical protein
MATATQIRTKALKKLGVLATGQTTQSEIQADLDRAYEEVYAALAAKNLVTWEIDEEVPDEYVMPVVALVAFARADEYGIPNDRYQRIAGNMTRATAEIRELQESNVYKTPTAVYY